MMPPEALDEALLRAKGGDEQPIRSLFSFLRDALARAEGQRDSYLLGWNKAAKQAAGQVQVKSESREREPKAKPLAAQKVVETEEDLGL